MRASQSNVFAYKKSGLEAFLYADVGAETNGSTLTILSILARLGKDPWMEAARWATLPKAIVIETLAQSIAEMPLTPAALAGAQENAVRLVQLLPTNTQHQWRSSATSSAIAETSPLPVTILYCALAVGLALSVLLMPRPSSNSPAMASHPTSIPEANHRAMRSSARRNAVVGSQGGTAGLANLSRPVLGLK